jgi:hypothetical protein
MGARKPKAESLEFEDLGSLESYADDELAWLREKLIADVERIHQESAQAQKRIKELNHSRHLLHEEAARRARALRAVKHQLTQRNTGRNTGVFERAPAKAAPVRPKARVR